MILHETIYLIYKPELEMSEIDKSSKRASDMESLKAEVTPIKQSNFLFLTRRIRQKQQNCIYYPVSVLKLIMS